MARIGFMGADGRLFKPSEEYKKIEKKKKKQEEAPAMAAVGQNKPTQTVKVNQTVDTVNNNDYKETDKKYGDYKYQDYANKKDYKVYEKDGKSYYYDEKRNKYVDMDEQSITSKEQDARDYQEALRQGFKGNKTYETKEKQKLIKGQDEKFSKDSKGKTLTQKTITEKTEEQVSPTKIADKVALDTEDLTEKEKEKYTKSLIKQEKQKGKELNYVRRSGTGIDALTGAYNNQINNPNAPIQKEIIQPLSNADRIYESGKLNNELALEWYKKMQGKSNKVDEVTKKVDKFNRFNQDVASGDVGFVGNSIQNLNTQVESLKNQGVAATAGGLAGAGIGGLAGLKTGNPVGGAAKGFKLGSKLGYTVGSTPYMYKLEAGNQYKDLKELGVSDDKAKKVAKSVGAINAAIESGENIIDLISFEGAGKLASKELKNKAAKEMKDEFTNIVDTLGEKEARDYLERLYGSGIADSVIKTYGKNVFSEAGEEAGQETVGILGERYATSSEGIKRDGSQDLQRIGQAAVAGGGSALVLGVPTSIAGNTASYAMTKVQNLNDAEKNALITATQKRKSGQPLDQNDIAAINVINNKQIDPEVQMQNEVNQIQQAVQNGEMSLDEANNEMQQINSQMQPIEETTQPSVITQETQNTVQNENNEAIQEPQQMQFNLEENTKQEQNIPTTENKPTNSLKDIRQEVEEKTNKTMSKHIETSSKATDTVEDIKNMNYDDIVYDAMTNKESKEQALRELAGKDTDTNVNDIHAKFRGTERLTHVDSAKITELMKETKSLAEEAAKSGNDAEYNKRMEQFRTLKGDYAVALSESGQFVQYAKVIKELDPETQIDVLKKVIEREQRRGNKKYEDVTINEDLVKKYKNAKTDEERDTIMEEIKDDTARQIKITFADKANEFRFLSMLGNIKTHGRNIFGNTGMYSLQTFKDGVATIGEEIYDKASKNGLETRSKTLKPATKEVSKYVNNTVDSFLKDQKSKYNESRGMKGDLENRTKKFSDKNPIGKALNKFSDWNSKALDFEDRFFSSLMTKQAMKGFLTANGIETNADIEAHPELVAQALDYALFKGKEATFHQDSTTATAIRNTRDKLYTGSGFSKLGGLAIDTTLPFVSTPVNIAKNALEYTPIIGFGDINKQLQQAPDSMKANVFIDSISKQFSGAALIGVGAYLASLGLVKGAGEGDKEDKTEASLGNASYAIKLGNSTYDLSWLSPTAIPFFEGVEIYNALNKVKSKGGLKATDTADLIDTMFGALNPMTDMSVMQSIERVMTSIAYGGNAVKSAASTTFSSYLQQYIPTLLSQFAQIGDSKQRNTNTGGNVLEKTYDQIKYKVPLARNTLPEKLDVWGNANKTASNIPQRMFEALLSPANRKDYKVDKTTKELERLARETDDTSMLPTVKNKSLRVNGEDYKLKGKDYVNLQRTYGKTAKENLDALIQSEAYQNASDTKKKSMVSKLYDYASYKAKEEYAKNKGINFDSGDQTAFAMVDAFDIPYETYVENKVSGNESTAKMLKKLNNAGLSEAQKGAVMNYFDRAYYVDEDELYDTLENSGLSDKQKELVREKYEKNITDKERERYQRANNIGVDYDLYTNFRSFVAKATGDSKRGGLSKKQKVINWIQDQELTAQQKYSLYNDYINNQGIISYYK